MFETVSCKYIVVQTYLLLYVVKPAPLEIKPLPEWEELPAPVRSPITRSFTRE